MTKVYCLDSDSDDEVSSTSTSIKHCAFFSPGFLIIDSNFNYRKNVPTEHTFAFDAIGYNPNEPKGYAISCQKLLIKTFGGYRAGSSRGKELAFEIANRDPYDQAEVHRKALERICNVDDHGILPVEGTEEYYRNYFILFRESEIKKLLVDLKAALCNKWATRSFQNANSLAFLFAKVDGKDVPTPLFSCSLLYAFLLSYHSVTKQLAQGKPVTARQTETLSSQNDALNTESASECTRQFVYKILQDFMSCKNPEHLAELDCLKVPRYDKWTGDQKEQLAEVFRLFSKRFNASQKARKQDERDHKTMVKTVATLQQQPSFFSSCKPKVSQNAREAVAFDPVTPQLQSKNRRQRSEESFTGLYHKCQACSVFIPASLFFKLNWTCCPVYGCDHPVDKESFAHELVFDCKPKNTASPLGSVMICVDCGIAKSQHKDADFPRHRGDCNDSASETVGVVVNHFKDNVEQIREHYAKYGLVHFLDEDEESDHDDE